MGHHQTTIGVRPAHKTGMQGWAMYLSLMLLSSPLSAQTTGWITDPRAQFRDVIIPIYRTNHPQAIASIRVKGVAGDYQRRGFFRIGVLPVLVIKGLTLEIGNRADLQIVLNKVSAHIPQKTGTGHIVEGRDLLLSVGSPATDVLQASCARPDSSGVWRLEDGTFTSVARPPISFHHAVLKMTGPNTGELTCETPTGRLSTCLSIASPQR